MTGRALAFAKAVVLPGATAFLIAGTLGARKPGKKPGRAFAPEAVPAIRVIPKAVTLGGTAALEVQVEMPARAGQPHLTTLAGGSLSEPRLEDGLWIAVYKPPFGQTAPGYDVILAESKGGIVGSSVVGWIAKAKLPVTVQKAGAQVTVTVGGRDFGPVTARAGQTVPVEVEIPPGAREVTVTAVSEGGEPVHTTEPLAVPPLARVLVDAPSQVAKLGAPFDAEIVAIGKDGKVARTPPRIDAGANASLVTLEEVGPGVWRASIVPRDGAVAMIVHGESSRSRVVVRAPKRAEPAATPTLAPTPAATPAAIAAAIPPSPTCEQLHALPGEITTARELKARISQATALPDMIERRDALIAIACRFPDEHAVQLQLAATDLLLGDHEATISVVDPLLSDEGEIHDDHVALALSYRAAAELRLGEIDGAIVDAKASEARMPGLYSATYTLGEAEFLEKKFPDATSALLSAYKTAPQFASAIDHEMLAELLERRGDLGEAVEHRMAMARLSANDVELWRAAAHAAESARSWARAQEAWAFVYAQSIPGLAASRQAWDGILRAEVNAPKDVEVAFFDAALEAVNQKNPSKAVFLLQKVLGANPHNVAARYFLARALYDSSAFNRAALEADGVLNDAPHWAPALILAGDAAKQKGDRNRAESRYREALSLDPPSTLNGVAKWRLSELTTVPNGR